uniref:Uncharacterized protein n=1 Tax=Anguilla anguilla TaxID=7936 RepID=A0A0E9PLL0_ANGAN
MPNTIPFLTMITVLDNQTADPLTVRESYTLQRQLLSRPY